MIVVVAAVRFVRRPSLYRLAIAIAGITLAVQLVLVVLGLPLLFSLENLGQGTDLGTAPTWGELAFAIPVAMLAYTGLETVANLAAETREPGKTLPRSLFVGIGAAVRVGRARGSRALRLSGTSRRPPRATTASDLGTVWLKCAADGDRLGAFDGHLPGGLVDGDTESSTGASGVLVLAAAITTSMSGAGRVAYSLGRTRCSRERSERLSRRTLLSPVVDCLDRL